MGDGFLLFFSALWALVFLSPKPGGCGRRNLCEGDLWIGRRKVMCF